MRILATIWKRQLSKHNAALAKRLKEHAAEWDQRAKQLFAALHQDIPSHEKQAYEDEVASAIKRRDRRLQRAAQVEKYQPTISPKGYGCLRGLVQEWGEAAPDLLLRTMTLEGWDRFMAAVKVQIAESGGTFRYFSCPSITVIRRYWMIALEIAFDDAQDGGSLTVQQSNQLLGILTKAKLADAKKVAGKQAT